jgi:hypothetical protein
MEAPAGSVIRTRTGVTGTIVASDEWCDPQAGPGMRCPENPGFGKAGQLFLIHIKLYRSFRIIRKGIIYSFDFSVLLPHVYDIFCHFIGLFTL